jgi:tetratricopeptide (TPR) repeat protein
MHFNKNLFLLLALNVFLFSSLFSQVLRIDSLQKAAFQENDSQKIKTLIDLSYALSDNAIEKATEYAKEALSIADDRAYAKFKIRSLQCLAYLHTLKNENKLAISNYKKALAIAEESKQKKYASEVCFDIADLYSNINETKKALQYYNKSIETAKQINNKSLLLLPFNGLATLYYNQAKYDEALYYYMEGLAIAEELKNKTDIAQCMQNVGNVHYANKNYDLALGFYEQALTYNQEIGNKEAIAGCTNNIGVMYEQKKGYYKALIFYFKALELKKELNDKRGMENTYLNIGNIYLIQENIEKAIEYYTNSLLLATELKDKNGLALANINLGKLYLKKKSYDKALTYLNEGLKFSKALNRKTFIQSAYEELSDLYSKKENYKQAHIYHKLFASIKDSILNETTAKNIAELQTKYETEKKDQQIAVLNIEQEKQKVVLFATLGGLTLLVILSVLLFALFRIKQKSNLQLSEANLQLEKSKLQILDSINYAKTIQDSILPSEQEIKNLLPDSFVFFQPKDIVSGDFYWIAQQDDLLFVALADCTGHGVPGAFMSMAGNALLNEIVTNLHTRDTAKVLALLNEGIIQTLHSGSATSGSKDGMAISILAINKKERTIEIALSDHLAYCIKGNELTEIKGVKSPIGQKSDTVFVSEKIVIEKNMGIYLSSDGFQDQFGGEPRRKYGRKKLKELFQATHSMDCEIQKNIIAENFFDWKKSNAQIDDVLVMGIKFS